MWIRVINISPVKPDSPGLFGVHFIMVQKQPDHLVMSVPSSNDERSGPLSGLLGHVLQQVPGLNGGVVQEQGGQGQDSPLAGRFVNISGQGLQPGQSRYLRHLCKIRPLISEQIHPPPIKNSWLSSTTAREAQRASAGAAPLYLISITKHGLYDLTLLIRV